MADRNKDRPTLADQDKKGRRPFIEETGSLVVGHQNRANALDEKLSGNKRGEAPPDKYGIGTTETRDKGIDSQHVVGKSDERHKIQPGQYADLDDET